MRHWRDRLRSKRRNPKASISNPIFGKSTVAVYTKHQRLHEHEFAIDRKAERGDSCPHQPLSICKLQNPHCQRCQTCHRCHRPLHAIARWKAVFLNLFPLIQVVHQHTKSEVKIWRHRKPVTMRIYKGCRCGAVAAGNYQQRRPVSRLGRRSESINRRSFCRSSN